jgi:hypothetical protein
MDCPVRNKNLVTIDCKGEIYRNGCIPEGDEIIEDGSDTTFARGTGEKMDNTPSVPGDGIGKPGIWCGINT